MSETVHHRGIITEIPKENKTTEELAMSILQENGINELESYYDSAIEYLLYGDLKEDYFYYKKTDTLYKMSDSELDPYDDIIRANKVDEKTIEYECRFYNGGASLNECITKALDDLNNKK